MRDRATSDQERTSIKEVEWEMRIRREIKGAQTKEACELLCKEVIQRMQEANIKIIRD